MTALGTSIVLPNRGIPVCTVFAVTTFAITSATAKAMAQIIKLEFVFFNLCP